MRRGIRRPLIALVALVVALAVGYGVRAGRSDDHPPTPAPTSGQPAPTSTHR